MKTTTTLLLIVCVFAVFCLFVGLLLSARSYPVATQSYCTAYRCFSPPLNPWP